MTTPPDERPPFVVAMEWASRITTISIESLLPILAGYWLDRRLGTRVLFLIIGAALGFVISLWSLIRLTKPTGGSHDSD
jgi:F0F1-type ATP synthase assembly protein I